MTMHRGPGRPAPTASCKPLPSVCHPRISATWPRTCKAFADMRLRYSVLLLALALTACGRQESAADRAPAAAPAAATAPRSAAPTGASAQQKPAEPAADPPSKITRMNEDGSETVEDVPSDSGAHNPLLAAVASTVAATTPTASAASLA